MFLKGVVESPVLPVPTGTDQYWLRCFASHGLGDRTKAEPIQTGPRAAAQYNQVSLARIRVQQDHAGRIAVLNAHSEANAGRLCSMTQRADQGDAFSAVPLERPIRRNGVNNQEFRVMHTAQRECMIERGPRGLREVNCG